MNAEPTESESSQLDEMIEPTDDAAVSEDSAPDFDLDDDQLDAVLESLLLVVDSPAEVNQLASVTGTAPERVEQRLTLMSAALTARGSGMDLRYAGDGWRLYTRQEFAPYVEKLLLDGARTKLTRAALETLAVVAYRQPLTRARISAVRGVNVDGVVRTLLARGLIAEAGPDPETNATRYSTTELFLERLGLASLSELPELAPLLPDVDLIDDISESLESDPRFARMNKADVPADVVDTEVDD
ncbi:SMC-Scp complex subunit ScpB [Rhodococcus sp. NPDC060176]|uniref:SMC-Scp complex subunit ScpB n=1 Tax=Rhodococcus sp. NPDC060176 TaxID=3347062 RepID=UPI003665F2E3